MATVLRPVSEADAGGVVGALEVVHDRQDVPGSARVVAMMPAVAPPERFAQVPLQAPIALADTTVAVV